MVVNSSVKKRRSDGFRTRSICSWYLGRFPNSKTLLSFSARARKHLSLSLVRKSTFARSTPCFAASLSFHVNQLASWLGWIGLCWRILYTVKRHRYLVQDDFYVRGVITPNVRCLVQSVSASCSSSPPHSKLLFGLTVNARLHWSPRMPSSFVGIIPKIPFPRSSASRNGATDI